MMSLRYLVACAAAGVMVGRLFGVFARAGFHYPLRIDEAPYWQQAVLNALQVVKWPGLFGLTLAAALVLWRWLGPHTTARARSSKPIAMLAGTFGVVGAIIVVPLTNQPASRWGIRGENAMINGLALIIGLGLFVAEGLLAGVVAAIAKRSGEQIYGGGSDSAVVV